MADRPRNKRILRFAVSGALLLGTPATLSACGADSERVPVNEPDQAVDDDEIDLNETVNEPDPEPEPEARPHPVNEPMHVDDEPPTPEPTPTTDIGRPPTVNNPPSMD